MFLVFEIIFSLIPVCFVIFLIMTAIKNSKKQSNNSKNESFDDIFKKIEMETKKFDEEDRGEVLEKVQRPTQKYDSDKELEEELTRRFQALENKTNTTQSHDETCQENSCDGCGSQDVYAQVYGKRKKNKLKK